MSTMTSQITSLTFVCLLNHLFRRRSKKTSKLRVTGICAGDRWIPRTKGQKRGKCFHLMTSSWDNNDKLERWPGCADSTHIWQEINEFISIRSSEICHIIQLTEAEWSYMRQWTMSTFVQIIACSWMAPGRQQNVVSSLFVSATVC